MLKKLQERYGVKGTRAAITEHTRRCRQAIVDATREEAKKQIPNLDEQDWNRFMFESLDEWEYQELWTVYLSMYSTPEDAAANEVVDMDIHIDSYLNWWQKCGHV